MSIRESDILNALSRVNDPELRRSIVDLGMVRDINIENGRVTFTLALTIPECPLRDQLLQDARADAMALGAMSEAERAAVLGRNEPPACVCSAQSYPPCGCGNEW